MLDECCVKDQPDKGEILFALCPCQRYAGSRVKMAGKLYIGCHERFEDLRHYVYDGLKPEEIEKIVSPKKSSNSWRQELKSSNKMCDI